MRSILLLLTLAGAASAATIVFKGTPTGVSDGTYNVLPYQITINGNLQLVACYDIYDEVSVGDTWTANLLSVTQAATTGYFDAKPNPLAGYEKIAWLSVQSYSNTDEQIGLQHAIWNVFGSASVTPATTVYNDEANAAAAGGYAGFDFSSFVFIEEVDARPGVAGTKQAFVTQLPEPGTLGMMAAGALLLLIGSKRKFKPAVS